MDTTVDEQSRIEVVIPNVIKLVKRLRGMQKINIYLAFSKKKREAIRIKVTR